MIEDMELYLEKVFKKENPEVYIEILEQDREDFAKEIIELQDKIDKAIEYINEFSWYYAEDDGTKGFVIEEEKEETFVKDILKILGDKENE